MGRPALLAMGPMLVSPLLSGIVYVAARRRLQEGQDSTSRAHLFYRLISYSLLGQFLGHANGVSPAAAAAGNAWLVPILVAVGYFALDTVEGIVRAWRGGGMDGGGGGISDDVALNRSAGVDHTVLLSTNVSAPNFQHAVFVMQDIQSDLRKRRWILALLLALFFVISFVDGLELIIAAATKMGAEEALLYVFYYMHTLSLALTAYAAMVHCRLQRLERTKTRWLVWFALTILVTLIIGVSAIMLLSGSLGALEAQRILSDPALIVFYGLAAGVLLRVQQYFHAVKLQSLDRWDTLAGIVMAALVLSETMVTSVFF